MGNYKLSTKEFYIQFSQGTLGDETEYMKWAGEYELLQDLQSDLEKVREVRFAD